MNRSKESGSANQSREFKSKYPNIAQDYKVYEAITAELYKARRAPRQDSVSVKSALKVAEEKHAEMTQAFVKKYGSSWANIIKDYESLISLKQF